MTFSQGVHCGTGNSKASRSINTAMHQFVIPAMAPFPRFAGLLNAATCLFVAAIRCLIDKQTGESTNSANNEGRDHDYAVSMHVHKGKNLQN